MQNYERSSLAMPDHTQLTKQFTPLVVISHSSKLMNRENASITCRGLNRCDCSMSFTLRFIVVMSCCQFPDRKPFDVSKAKDKTFLKKWLK